MATRSCYEASCYNERSKEGDVMMVGIRKWIIAKSDDEAQQGAQVVD